MCGRDCMHGPVRALAHCHPSTRAHLSCRLLSQSTLAPCVHMMNPRADGCECQQRPSTLPTHAQTQKRHVTASVGRSHVACGAGLDVARAQECVHLQANEWATAVAGACVDARARGRSSRRTLALRAHLHARQPKVRHFCVAVRVQQHVSGLEVSVHDGRMQVPQRRGDVQPDRERQPQRQPAACGVAEVVDDLQRQRSDGARAGIAGSFEALRPRMQCIGRRQCNAWARPVHARAQAPAASPCPGSSHTAPGR